MNSYSIFYISISILLAVGLVSCNFLSDNNNENNMSIAEALRKQPDGVINVRGFLYQYNGDVQLCDELLESFPPQCGSPSLVVRGLDLDTIPDLVRAEGCVWTKQMIEVSGILRDKVLTAKSNAKE